MLQLGALLVVLIAVSAPLFDLDRYQVPKELVLHAAAFGAALLALREARRLPISLVDLLLIGYGLLTIVSAFGAINPWLGFRAVGVTWAGLALFWTARGIARAGLARPLLATLAFAITVGAATGLLQAYGVELPFDTARRAPGGAFGNRNFMAHLTAIGVPLLVYLTLDSRARIAPYVGAAGLAISSAALLLSRSRAAWLAVTAGIVLLLVEGVWISGLGRDSRIRGRLLALAASAALGVAAAVLIPNVLEWRSDNPYLESLVGVANFREGSGRGRLVQYGNTLHMAGDHPLLGVGPGNWPVNYPRYTTPGDPAFDPGDPIPTNPWPSSDWVAIVAERGVTALLLLGAAGGCMGFIGWRRSREAGRGREGLAGLAMVATLTVVAVVGTFDAVLLLATPTFFVWPLLGALLPPPRQVGEIHAGLSRRTLFAATAAAGLALTARSTLQLASMMIAGSGRSTRAVEWAAALDPGSYRLHLHLARASRGRAACVRIRHHAGRASELYPFHAAPRQLLRRCGVRIRTLSQSRSPSAWAAARRISGSASFMAVTSVSVARTPSSSPSASMIARRTSTRSSARYAAARAGAAAPSPISPSACAACCRISGSPSASAAISCFGAAESSSSSPSARTAARRTA